MFQNITENETCPYCLDDAQVLVGTETRPVFDYRDKQGKRVPSHSQAAVAKKVGTEEFDQYGPCPFCERGKLLEFPPPDKDGNQRMGPWGKAGYWRGRSTDHLKPQAMEGSPPDPQQVRELLTSTGWLKEMP